MVQFNRSFCILFLTITFFFVRTTLAPKPGPRSSSNDALHSTYQLNRRSSKGTLNLGVNYHEIIEKYNRRTEMDFIILGRGWQCRQKLFKKSIKREFIQNIFCKEI